MKTKSLCLCFVFVLTLSALACVLPVQTPSLGSVTEAFIASQTVTASPSFTPTSTLTFTPSPTNTPTATYTATPRVAMAIVVATENVNIRAKPCYQTILTQVKPGTKFPATGWFRSSKGEQWVRVEVRLENGLLVEAWVHGNLVELTNTDLLPFVPEVCIDTPTPTPELPDKVRKSYIRLYRHESFGGDSLEIKITDCGRVNIDPTSPLNDAVSSFDLFAPENVKVYLVEHHTFDSRFPGRYVVWRGNNGHLQVNIAELKAVGIHDVVSSIVWVVDGEWVPGTCQR